MALTGPGGVGKTRLALAVAEVLRNGSVDGVAFVDLAPLTDPAHVVPAIARALGVRETANGPLQETLQAFLRPRQLLLVIDNCEHLLPGTLVLAELLDAAPRVVLLVTSRMPLQLTGEQRYPVLPLPIPAREQASSPALQTNPAVQLFLDRARLVQPAFALTSRDAPAIAELCRLAIRRGASCARGGQPAGASGR